MFVFILILVMFFVVISALLKRTLDRNREEAKQKAEREDHQIVEEASTENRLHQETEEIKIESIEKVEENPEPNADAPKTNAHNQIPARNIKHTFRVAGVYYHEDNLKQLLEPNNEYDLPASELKEYYDDGDRIYKFEYDPYKVSLIPEPENEHDPNAIRVELDDVFVGYIKKTQTSSVRKLFKKDNVYISAEVYGGPYKIIIEDDDGKIKVEKRDSGYGINITITSKQ